MLVLLSIPLANMVLLIMRDRTARFGNSALLALRHPVRLLACLQLIGAAHARGARRLTDDPPSPDQLDENCRCPASACARSRASAFARVKRAAMGISTAGTTGRARRSNLSLPDERSRQETPNEYR